MKKNSKSVAKKVQVELPPDVNASDLKYPAYDSDKGVSDGIPYAKQQELGLDSTSLTFYLVSGRHVNDWVLLTLHISNPPRRQRNRGVDTTRSYGVSMDGKVCRVGLGPHVLKEVTVHLSQSNIERLKKYVDLFRKGLAEAGQIRDRISTRRAQGQIHRANGESSWMW